MWVRFYEETINGLHSPLMAPVDWEAFVMYFNHLPMSGICEPLCSGISINLTSKTVITLAPTDPIASQMKSLQSLKNHHMERKSILIPAL